jgi:hypothetical protein
MLCKAPTPRHVAPFSHVSPATDLWDELASTEVKCACGGAVTLSAVRLLFGNFHNVILQSQIKHHN